jgi:hypothetical protein
MDFHAPEFPPTAIKNFNAQKFVDHLEYGKINLVALFAKDHFGNSFYNTQIGHKHRGLEADFLRETATECRQRGIRTLAYYSLCVDKHAYDENPDWRYVDDQGQTYAKNFGSVCMNTPYKDELALPQLAEIAHYPVDGLFIDIPMPWGAPDYFCTCKFCRKRWREEFGIEISPALPAVERMRLSLRIIESYLLQLRDLIQRTRPELVLCVNQVGTDNVSKNIKELVEIGVWESQPRPGDYLGHSFSCRVGRNDIVDTQVMTVRFYEGWGDMSLKPTAQLTTELAAIIGNGMVPNVGDQVNMDGTLQSAVYDTFRAAFGFVEQHETLLKQAESVRHTTVLLPVPDPALPCLTGAMLAGKTDHWKGTTRPWRGVHKMLVESHLQTDLIYSVIAEDLSQFPLIILPEPGTYQPGMAARLRKYVENGGILLAVGNSILQNGRCELEDVFGIRYLEPLSFSVAHFTPSPEVRGETADLPLQVRGPVYKVLRTSAHELAALWFPMGETQPPVKGFRHPCPPAAPTRSPYPFTTVNRFGDGQAIYVAASIFDIYWQTNHHWLRQFIEALIRFVDPRQPVQIEASGRIEANLMRAGNDLLLNLMHYSLGHQGGQTAIAGIERVDPVHSIRCQVRCEIVEQVILEPRQQSIPFELKKGVCSFIVPELEYLTIVRLCGANRTR